MGKGKVIFASAAGVMMAAAGVAAASPAMAAPGPAVLWVATSGPTAGGGGSSCSHPGFTTIQAAINAAPSGSTVAVCAGTYAEQVQITKSVSVRAVGKVTVTLPGTPANSSTACDTAISAHTGLVDQDAIAICGPVSVSLTGLTLNAAWHTGSCAGGLYGVLVAGGGTLTFADSEITSAGPQPIDGCQHGIGIRAGVPGTTPAEPGHLIMRDSSVAGYQKGGVVVSAAGSTGLISNSTVRGAGPTPVIAQNGIQVSGDAKAAITGSTVSGNECNDAAAPCGPDGLNDTQSAGVLLFGAAPGTSVTRTTLRGNDIGVYDTPDTGVATPRQPGAVLAEDSFTGNRYEGVVLDQGNASVDASVFSGGNVGIEVLQYNGQVLRTAETASLDRFSGLSTASVDVLSDQATSGDLPGSFQISLSGTHTAPVLDNSANLPVIQRADF
jgi:hypothetical protein